MTGRDQKAQVSIKLISAWKEARNLNLDEQFCDRIVMERDPPQRLLGAIFGRAVWYEREHILTKRERQCLSLSSFGFDRADVAEFLNISPYTVQTHMKHVYTKLKVTTNAEAVAVAYRAKEII